jgi:hypothetical protein
MGQAACRRPSHPPTRPWSTQCARRCADPRSRYRRRVAGERGDSATAPPLLRLRRSCRSRRGRGIALRGFVPSPRVAFRKRPGSRVGSARRRRDAVFAKLSEKGGRARPIRKGAQRVKRVLGTEREHSAECVGVDTNPTEFVQQSLKSLLVRQPASVTGSPSPTGRTIINKPRIIPISKIMPRGLNCKQ